MSAIEILDEARNLGVKLRVEGDRIKAKGPRLAVERLLPVLREHKPQLLAALARPQPAAANPNTDSGHWLIIRAERMERWFSPTMTRAELEACYPGAVLIALPEAEPQRLPTNEESDEITRLLAAVAVREGFSEQERAEALDSALRDPQAALRCIRGLVALY